MDHTICPGSRLIRQPRPESILCPSCGTEAEIWSDEQRAKCPSCKRYVVREGFGSCLDWCKMAKDCVGSETFDRYVMQRSGVIRGEIVREMEAFFGGDKKRIAHAKQVLQYAEALLKQEKGEWNIVVPTAILHDVGIKIAEEKYGSSAGPYQEQEGPPIARKILLKVGLRMEAIDEICTIIAHHHSPGKIDTPNFRILYDADGLVNAEETLPGKTAEARKAIIERLFLTVSGRRMAEEFFLSAGACT